MANPNLTMQVRIEPRWYLTLYCRAQIVLWMLRRWWSGQNPSEGEIAAAADRIARHAVRIQVGG